MSNTKKAFSARAGGFHIRFANGIVLSTQFKSGNYCNNYNAEYGKTEYDCDNCEIDIWDDKDNWITKDCVQETLGILDHNDDVLSEVSFENWLLVFDWCRSHTAN